LLLLVQHKVKQAKKIQAIVAALLDWFSQNARDLP